MKAWNLAHGYLLRFDRGETLPDALDSWFGEQTFAGASLHGIGALQDIELGFYDISARQYRRTVLAGSHELLSLTGNVCLVDGRPMVHAHVVVSGSDFAAHGGHLFKATVSVTVELFLSPHSRPISRQIDDTVGLRLLADAP